MERFEVRGRSTDPRVELLDQRDELRRAVIGHLAAEQSVVDRALVRLQRRGIGFVRGARQRPVLPPEELDDPDHR